MTGQRQARSCAEQTRGRQDGHTQATGDQGTGLDRTRHPDTDRQLPPPLRGLGFHMQLQSIAAGQTDKGLLEQIGEVDRLAVLEPQATRRRDQHQGIRPEWPDL